ncbi:MAG: SUMF1/EgtB/PvdO family nonheme iron enzyme, partial [Planctomycetes bacterium]|nr:SUMF1/EgtB/PvdO family nonheme iron enzyme [Planctomycetota bacterium]
PTQPAVARTPEAPAGPGGARGVPPPAEVPLPAGLLVRPGAPLDPLSRLPREVFGAKDGARMVLVPTGKFLYGERLEEHYLRAFYLDAEPVTNARYERFVREARRTAPEHWPGGAPARGRERHPVVNLAWLDAFLFAQWAGMALPTEEQWEKGARGADGREFPWGREFSRFLANTKEAGLGDTAPVERFEGGKSVYGALDMAGNAWCWTGSWLDEKQLWRVIRGGSFSDERFGCRTHLRYWMDPAKRAPNVGFRCVREVT